MDGSIFHFNTRRIRGMGGDYPRMSVTSGETVYPGCRVGPLRCGKVLTSHSSHSAIHVEFTRYNDILSCFVFVASAPFRTLYILRYKQTAFSDQLPSHVYDCNSLLKDDHENGIESVPRNSPPASDYAQPLQLGDPSRCRTLSYDQFNFRRFSNLQGLQGPASLQRQRGT
ncbi:hypothetical protein PM082_016354 [Marasmius tenuissimus]|nr:hypothetical protein PM082_016354 [Marasmius tenuissimus]